MNVTNSFHKSSAASEWRARRTCDTNLAVAWVSAYFAHKWLTLPMVWVWAVLLLSHAQFCGNSLILRPSYLCSVKDGPGKHSQYCSRNQHRAQHIPSDWEGLTSFRKPWRKKVNPQFLSLVIILLGLILVIIQSSATQTKRLHLKINLYVLKSTTYFSPLFSESKAYVYSPLILSNTLFVLTCIYQHLSVTDYKYYETKFRTRKPSMIRN